MTDHEHLEDVELTPESGEPTGATAVATDPAPDADPAAPSAGDETADAGPAKPTAEEHRAALRQQMAEAAAAGRTLVDPRGPRFGAAITTVVLAIALVTTPSITTVVLLVWQACAFGAAALFGLNAQPYGALYRVAVQPRLGPPKELEDEAPPRFAQQVGFGFVLVALVALAFNVTLVAQIAIAFALAAAFLNAAFNFCIGCEIYLLIQRFITRRKAALASEQQSSATLDEETEPRLSPAYFGQDETESAEDTGSAEEPEGHEPSLTAEEDLTGTVAEDGDEVPAAETADAAAEADGDTEVTGFAALVGGDSQAPAEVDLTDEPAPPTRRRGLLRRR